MATRLVCHRRQPSLTTLVLATLAVLTFVLLIAGWGVAFWICAGFTAGSAVTVLVRHRRHGPDDGRDCATHEDRP